METRSIFTRYDISNGARKVKAVERLAGALDAEPKKRQVIGLQVRHGKDGAGKADDGNL